MTAEKGKRPGWPPSVYPKTTISVTAYDPTIKLSRQIRPALPPEIQTVAASAIAMLEHERLNGECAAHAEHCLAIRRSLAELVGHMWTIADFHANLVSLSADQEAERARIARKTARLAALNRLPIWFWRREPPEVCNLERSVAIRARHLVAEGYLSDDGWDLLREYVSDWCVGENLSDEQLLAILKWAVSTQEGGRHADAS